MSPWDESLKRYRSQMSTVSMKPTCLVLINNESRSGQIWNSNPWSLEPGMTKGCNSAQGHPPHCFQGNCCTLTSPTQNNFKTMSHAKLIPKHFREWNLGKNLKTNPFTTVCLISTYCSLDKETVFPKWSSVSKCAGYILLTGGTKDITDMLSHRYWTHIMTKQFSQVCQGAWQLKGMSHILVLSHTSFIPVQPGNTGHTSMDHLREWLIKEAVKISASIVWYTELMWTVTK